MSLSTIIEKIGEEARRQCDEILAKAHLEAEQIAEHSRQKTDEEVAHILRHAQEEVELTRNKRVATAQLHARKERLDRRQQILDSLFDEALERVYAHDDAHRLELIKTILLSVPEEREGVILPSCSDRYLFTPDFLQEINQELAARQRTLTYSLSSECANVRQGFLLDFHDFDVNYSTEKVFSGLWEEIKGDVSKQLFEEA
ncbi:hypothetical protein CLOSPO_02378 [Candidatus Moduliflexus flocculans]|uniref:V-type ATP synthase subunit E n=1 Tax=Candidatus Moduliflexus flocculans TaxID=1499966 RepID=A0A081BRK5_9BACT|nr:hypothetical protein CLOSPO_02378 [Candidatus Moduliflexus flocculans]